MLNIGAVAATSRKRRLWLWAGLALLTVIIALVALTISVMPPSSEILRQRIVATLSDRLDSDVQLDSIDLRVYPARRAEGRGLVIRRRGQGDYPPLITIAHFIVDGSYAHLYRRRVTHLAVEGLDIEVPPGDDDID